MQEIEKLATSIGELVVAKVANVEKVNYIKNDIALVAFTITMLDGKSYLVAISDIS